jgi:hypothetical protein
VGKARTVKETTVVAGQPRAGNTAGEGAVTIVTTASLMQEYVAGGSAVFGNRGAMVAPWNFDDLTTDFGDQIYERMTWDATVHAAHVIWKKSILSDGFTLTAAPMDPIEKWKLDRRAALDRHKADTEKQQKAIEGAVPDPLHVSDPAAPTPAPKIPAPQPDIPEKPKPLTQQQQIALECEQMLARIEPPIMDVLNDMLDAGVHGNRVAELVWEYKATGTFAGKYVIKAIKVKHRRVVAFVVDRYFNIVGILNVRPGVTTPSIVGQIFTENPQDKDVILPREKFAILTNEPRNGDPRGTSRLRAAYTPWWGKMQLYPEYLKYLAQYGTPSLVGYTAPGAGMVTDQATGKSYTAQQWMVTTMTTFRGGSAMAFPNGSKVEPLMAGIASRSFQEDFAHFNEEISIAILTMDPNGGGRTGTGQAQSRRDTLAGIIRQDKRGLARMIERDLLTPYVKYNYGNDASESQVPACDFAGVNQPDLAAELAAEVQGGYSLSPSMFAGLDRKHGFPQRDPDELEAIKKRYIAGQNPTPAPTDQQGPPQGRGGGGFGAGTDKNARSDAR